MYYEDGCSPPIAEGEWELDEIQTFEDYDSEEENRVDEALQKKQEKEIVPLSEAEIHAFVMNKLENSVEQCFVYKRMRCQNMDLKGGLYIPLSCRDQFYYLRV